jgi:hypothetical protein
LTAHLHQRSGELLEPSEARHQRYLHQRRAVSPVPYLDERAYRYNNRKDGNENPLNDFDRFKAAMKQIVGKRLTWNQLTGKEPEVQTWFD